MAARRVAGLTIPPLKHFGPLLVVWGAAMLMLFFIRDVGSSLMFFGAFLALLYVATARFSYVVAGLALFFVGALLMQSTDPPHRRPGGHLARPLAQQGAWAPARSSSRSSPRPTAGCSARGWASRCSSFRGRSPRTAPSRSPTAAASCPAPHTDEIFAVIVCELGLFGGAGLIAVYALIAARGFKIAVMARDGFSKLLAAGLTAVFALQAFVIIGGVVRFIPLTGVTLPFVSFGGSSVIANMILLGLLLMISDDARRPRPASGAGRRVGGAAGVNPPIVRLYGLLLLLFAALVGFTSYWAVFDSDQPQGQPREPPPADRRADGQARHDQDRRRRDGGAESHPVGGGKHPVYVRDYPQGSEFGEPGGLQLHPSRPDRHRALRERRPRRRAERVHLDPRPASRRPPGGRQRHPHDRRARAAGRDSGAAIGDRLARPGRAAPAGPWLPSTPPPGRSRRWRRCRVTTRTRSRTPRSSSS